MPSAAVVGTTTQPHDCWSDGVLTAGSGTVTIGGKPACTVGDPGTPHSWTCPGSNSPHDTTIMNGSSSVMIDGKPVARTGDYMSCGAKIGAGDSSVIIGG